MNSSVVINGPGSGSGSGGSCDSTLRYWADSTRRRRHAERTLIASPLEEVFQPHFVKRLRDLLLVNLWREEWGLANHKHV